MRLVVWLNLEVNESPHLQEGMHSHDSAHITRQMPSASFKKIKKMQTHLLMSSRQLGFAYKAIS